jgi:hypothetical protein
MESGYNFGRIYSGWETSLWLVVGDLYLVERNMDTFGVQADTFNPRRKCTVPL